MFRLGLPLIAMDRWHDSIVSLYCNALIDRRHLTLLFLTLLYSHGAPIDSRLVKIRREGYTNIN